MRLVCCVACRSPVRFRPSSPTCQPDGTCVFPRPAKTSFAGERGFVNLSGRTLRSVPGEQHWKHRRHLPAPSEGCRPVERTFAAGSFVAMDSVVASPAAVAGSRERPRGRATQTALSVASTATQCALQFFSTAECQTEADCAVHVPGCVPAGAPLEALLPPPPPPAQHGVGPSCSWHSGNPGWVRLPLDRKRIVASHRDRIPIQAVCGVKSGWQSQHQEANRTILEKGSVASRGCSVCKGVFCWKGALSPTGKKSYTCDVCQESFIREQKYFEHQKRHTGEKPHSCSICHKCFTKKSDLKKHGRLHKNVRSFACHMCLETFTQAADLLEHERLHTGEKPYTCTVCWKSFARKVYLVRHRRGHTGEKPYMCPVCGKGFSHTSHLVVHKKMHTGERPYTCSACCKSFARKIDLGRHERVHTGEKPFVCIVCQKSFALNSNLLRHERLHTGEKPYVCPTCQQRFTLKANLLKHEKLHRSENP